MFSRSFFIRKTAAFHIVFIFTLPVEFPVLHDPAVAHHNLSRCIRFRLLVAVRHDYFMQLGDMLNTLQARVMSNVNPSEIIEQLIERTGYRDYVLDGTPQAEEREANLGVLAADAQAFATLSDFLEEVVLMSTADQANDAAKVTLMTLHAAKGLEFPVVFMAGMEDGLFPSERALEEGPRSLEEERRLCYVGMTRAHQELYLTYAQSRQQSH